MLDDRLDLLKNYITILTKREADQKLSEINYGDLNNQLRFRYLKIMSQYKSIESEINLLERENEVFDSLVEEMKKNINFQWDGKILNETEKEHLVNIFELKREEKTFLERKKDETSTIMKLCQLKIKHLSSSGVDYADYQMQRDMLLKDLIYQRAFMVFYKIMLQNQAVNKGVVLDEEKYMRKFEVSLSTNSRNDEILEKQKNVTSVAGILRRSKNEIEELYKSDQLLLGLEESQKELMIMNTINLNMIKDHTKKEELQR